MRRRRRPAAMGRPYTALHKNLAEVESALRRLRAADPDAASERRTACGEMMAGKIDFVRALLAAGKEVQAAGAQPPHILHFDERLRTLEEALRDCDAESGVFPPAEDDEVLRHACSCTDECFEEDEDDGGVPEPEDFGTIMDENLEESEGSDAAADEEGEGETQPGRRCRCRCVTAAVRQCQLIGLAVATVAAVAVGTGVATNLYSVEEFSLVPT